MAHPYVYAISLVVGVGACLYFYFTQQTPQNPHSYSNTQNTYDDFAKDSNTCTICIEPISMIQRQKLQCGHSFHKKCVKKWMETQKSCPNCRKEANSSFH